MSAKKFHTLAQNWRQGRHTFRPIPLALSLNPQPTLAEDGIWRFKIDCSNEDGEGGTIVTSGAALTNGTQVWDEDGNNVWSTRLPHVNWPHIEVSYVLCVALTIGEKSYSSATAMATWLHISAPTNSSFGDATRSCTPHHPLSLLPLGPIPPMLPPPRRHSIITRIALSLLLNNARPLKLDIHSSFVSPQPRHPDILARPIFTTYQLVL